MATKKSTDSPAAPQTPRDLSALAARLVEHAESIRNPAAARGMGNDLREAARVIEHLRTGIEAVIQSTKDDDLRARLTELLGGT